MIISVNWLKKYLQSDVDIDELTNLIGARLVEIESVSNLAEKYQSPVIAKVVECIAHPDSDHLHVCQVDDGGVPALLGGDGAALHVGRVVVVSGRDRHLTVLDGILL